MLGSHVRKGASNSASEARLSSRRSSSTNARVSSHVGSRPAASHLRERGRARSRSDRIGSPSTVGQAMSSAGSSALMVCSRSGAVARRAQVHHRRIIFQRKESVAQALGEVDRPAVGRRAQPNPTGRRSVTRPGCRRPRRTPMPCRQVTYLAWLGGSWAKCTPRSTPGCRHRAVGLTQIEPMPGEGGELGIGEPFEERAT